MKKIVVLISVWLAMVPVSWAELTIEITQGRDNPTPIAVVPMGLPGEFLKDDISSIVAADLSRTGQFSPMARGDMLSTPRREAEVFYRDWRASNVDYLVVGNMVDNAGQLSLQYELFDVLGQKKILSGTEVGNRQSLRDMAHRISDAVYEKLTGIRGAFSTKLLYVSAVPDVGGKTIYRLLMSDVDGAREKIIVSQTQPLLTPTWAPDGHRIAYVSFETTRPAIFLHDLRTGQRRQMTNFKGLNGAPSWSPDGRKLALVLSKDGSPDVYTLDITTGNLQRITRHFAIETEPAWMPDGKSLIYTSDRGGRPQIYQVNLATGYEERLTFDGRYNARGRVTPDGKGIIMVHQDEGGEFHIARLDLGRGVTTILTDTALDESPSIAPNGAMLLYATKYRGKGILAAVSLDGGVKFRLPSRFGDVREPAWSPFLN